MFETIVNHINNSDKPEQAAFWSEVAYFALTYTAQRMNYDKSDEKYTFKRDPTVEED